MTKILIKYLILILWLLQVNSFAISWDNNLSQTGSGTTQNKYANITPVIERTDISYSNKSWELFIYWKNFGTDKTKITIVLKKNFDWTEATYNPAWVYESIINTKILNEFRDWEIKVISNSGIKDENWRPLILESNWYKVDFNLPSLSKVYSENKLWAWEYIYLEGANFKKPTYWMLNGTNYICQEESSTSCKFQIPATASIKWKFGVSSFGYSYEPVMKDLSNPKVPNYKLNSISASKISIKILNYTFEELRKSEITLDEAKLNTLSTREWVKINIWWKYFADCTVSKSDIILSCSWNNKIYYKWVGYVEIFWTKSQLFNYELETPQIDKIDFALKYSYLRKISPTTKEYINTEGNYLVITVSTTDFDYKNANNLKLYINDKEHSNKNDGFKVSKNQIEIILDELPPISWDIYLGYSIKEIINDSTTKKNLTNYEILSKSVPYNIWNYYPTIYEVWATSNENEYYIKWANLTNFTDQNSVITFEDSDNQTMELDTETIGQQEAKKLNLANSSISNLNQKISLLEKQNTDTLNNKSLSDSEINSIVNTNKLTISDLKSQIKDNQDIINTIKSWHDATTSSEKNIQNSKIINKSDTYILFNLYDNDEQGKKLKKWEYDVTVSSNDKKSNVVTFFFNPNQNNNISYPTPVVTRLEYPQWAWVKNLIKLVWTHLNFWKEVYFSWVKCKIVSQDPNNMIVKLSNSVPDSGPITMKDNLMNLTNTLFIYNPLSNQENQIKLNWAINPTTTKQDSNENKFTLEIKNYYKEAFLKHLELNIISSWKYNREKLPFYDVNLYQQWRLIAAWIINTKQSQISFEPVIFDNPIMLTIDPVKDLTKLDIVINSSDNAIWEYKFTINSAIFYDAYNLPNQIKSVYIDASLDPYFLKLNTKQSRFCISKVDEDTWQNCVDSNTEPGKEEDVFVQESFKTIKAPARQNETLMNFKDIYTNNWFYPFIFNLYQRNIISWYPDWTFKAWNNINRWEAIKILMSARNETIPTYFDKDSFAIKDLPEWYWGKNMLEYAIRQNLIRPVQNFHVENNITRSEATKLICKFFNRVVPKTNKNYFKDMKDHWANDYVQYLYENWIVSWTWEEKIFNPDNFVTRAEFSKMISKWIDLWSE